MIDFKTAQLPRSRSRTQVRDWLLNLLAESQYAPGDRLPPSRELARKLDISLSSMQGVLKELNQMGILSSQIGRGTFLLKKPAQPQREIRIALGFPAPTPPRSNTWHGKIVSGLIQAGLHAQHTINWIPLQKSASNLIDSDALILLPGSKQNSQLQQRFVDQGKLVLHYNAPAMNATTDFVSPDYYQASALLASSLVASGRRRLAILYGYRIQGSVSANQRCAGFMSPLLKQLGKSIDVEFFGDSGSSEACGYSTVMAMLQQGYHADAIYCFGDNLALGAVSALQNAGKKVPSEVSVVGGSGLDLRTSTCPGLTLLEQPFNSIGETMITMIAEGLRNPGRPLPGRYLPCHFSGGATTTAAENRALAIDTLHPNQQLNKQVL